MCNLVWVSPFLLHAQLFVNRMERRKWKTSDFTVHKLLFITAQHVLLLTDMVSCCVSWTADVHPLKLQQQQQNSKQPMSKKWTIYFSYFTVRQEPCRFICQYVSSNFLPVNSSDGASALSLGEPFLSAAGPCPAGVPSFASKCLI